MPWSNWNVDNYFAPTAPMDGINRAITNSLTNQGGFNLGQFFDNHGSNLLGMAGIAGNAFMGMQQYGMARRALRQSQDQFNKNFAAQRQTLNTAMEDRQRARVASNPGAYESVGDYMERNRI